MMVVEPVGVYSAQSLSEEVLVRIGLATRGWALEALAASKEEDQEA